MQMFNCSDRGSSSELEKLFASTIRSYVPQGSRIMLGYSGGPDSEALLQLYLASSLEQEYPLHLVHIDHGWREESQLEAFCLREKAFNLNLPFHTRTLAPSDTVGNLENWARQERQSFFEDIGAQIGSPWLLLGHHKDDSVEVVLRRLMEGSHLIHASGMTFLTVLNSLRVLRPLLFFEKKDLLSYLNEKRCGGRSCRPTTQNL